MKRNTTPAAHAAPPAPAQKNAKTNSAPAKTPVQADPVLFTLPAQKPTPRANAAPRAKNVKTNPTTEKKPKTITVKTAKTNPAQPVRVVTESVLEGGALWKMSGRHGVAYIKDAALAGELLATEPKNLAKAAMAVYYDKKGKAFAWQIRFDTDRWEEVLRRLA